MTAVLDLPQLERALAAHALMSVTDLAGDIMYANERFCAVSGYSRTELLGRNHRLLKSGVHPPDFYADLWRTLKKGNIWDGLICNRRKTGENYWVQSTIMPLQNARGETVRYLSLRTEVTRQVELRAGLEALVLADSAAPFTGIAAAIAGALHALSVGIVRCARNAERADVLGEWRPGDMTPREHYALAGTPLAETLASSAPSVHVVERVCDAYPAAGDFLVAGALTYYGVPLREQDGQPFGVLYVQDGRSSSESETESALLLVAAVKAAAAILRSDDHRRLKESEARLRTLVNNAPVGVFMADIYGTLTFVSDPLTRRYGSVPDELLGDGWFALLAPVDVPRVAAAWRNFCVSEETNFLVEYHLRNLTGGFETLRTSAAPIVENGRRIGFVGTVENISNLRDLEDRLSQAQKMEALGAFTGGIAHDFNNILASILGYAGLTRKRLGIADQATLDAYLVNVEAAVLRGKELIERLLAFSRSAPEGQQQHVIVAQEALHEACVLLQAVLPASMSLKVAIEDGSWPIAVSPIELQQVLFNLVINARDANAVHGEIALSLGRHEASAEVCASCGTLFNGEFAEIACADSGMGIAAETLSRIFEPFFTTKRDHGGTGLGLAMVHGIVHKSSGHILVDSVLGQGTCFRMLFPRARPDTPDESESAHGEPALGMAVQPRRVMLVDDERAVVEPLSEALRGYGHETRSFVSPSDGLHELLARPTDYDVLICDMTMPELTGEELAVALRGAGLRLPIVMYSGSADAMAVERMEALAISALLHKPVAIPELLRAIEHAIKPSGVA